MKEIQLAKKAVELAKYEIKEWTKFLKIAEKKLQKLVNRQK
jgi:hypothetical protein